MATEKYWSSAAGVKRQAERWKEGQINVDFRNELESKTSRISANDVAFQECVREAMSKQGRAKPFAVPVVIEIDFTPGLAQNAPAIHSLPKHYLDLLQWPGNGTAKDKKRLLLKDDRLVKALIVSYWFGINHENPGLTLRINTFTKFIRQLQLASKIQNGELSDEIDEGERRTFLRRELLMEWEHDPQDDPLVQYRDHIKDKDWYTKTLGKEAFDVNRMFLQQQVQDKLLGLTDLDPIRLAGLLGPHLTTRKRSSFKYVADLLASQERQWYTLIGIDLGSPAVREGESKIFKKAVREKLAEVAKRQGLMAPLLTTIGATILYLPPKTANEIDVDNLARRIIPAVHDELHPPSSLQAIGSTFDRVRTTPSESEDQRQGELKALNRLPKEQVSRYQVFELPRSDSDPPDGRVQLILHSGLGSYGPWHEAEDTIDKWEEAVRRSRY